jgi:hypothetical protein
MKLKKFDEIELGKIGPQLQKSAIALEDPLVDVLSHADYHDDYHQDNHGDQGS